jgi:hypothetical protein
MARQKEPTDFDFGNYSPRHQALIMLARRKATALNRCTICGKYPVLDRRTLVHIALRSLGGEALDGRDYIRPLALCVAHCGRSNDELADHVWGTSWREQWS